MILSAALATAFAAPASAETPALIWRDISAIGIQCVVQPTTPAMREALCERVRALATDKAPAPVDIIAQGDPAILAPGTVTLLVHASLEAHKDHHLLAFSLRPFRVSSGQSAVLFGAAPRAADIPASGVISPALDDALRAALAETLPWQAQPEGPRRIQ